MGLNLDYLRQMGKHLINELPVVLGEVYNKGKRVVNDINNARTNGLPPDYMAERYSKGSFGEFASEYVLNNLAITDLSYIKTLHNVYLEKNGHTTEADVIALTEKGIFVLESKNYGGWIFGSEESRNWMQVFESGDKYPFYNPVKQNASHIKKLADFLNISTNCIFSYIVFSDRCRLQERPKDTEHLKIMYRKDLLWEMKAGLRNGRTFFIPDEIDEIYEKLLPLTVKTDEEKAQHIEDVKLFKEGEICPVCKRKLVIRNGKNGPFYGCSGFPDCRYTRNLEVQT